MAKKKKEEVVEEPQIETVVEEVPTPEPAPVVEKPKRREPTNRKLDDGWEVKARTYFLKRGKPLTYTGLTKKKDTNAN